MKKNITIFAIFVLGTFIYTNSLRIEYIDLIVLAGQSNMQGLTGNAGSYPVDPKEIDQRVRFYWVTPGHNSSKGKWTFLQPQGGRSPEGHFGPEVTLARQLVDDGCNLAVFKYSLGSTSLEADWKAPGQNGMYDQMIAELRRSVILLQEQGHKIHFKAFIWLQGESDAETKGLADGYGDRLKLLIQDFRKNVAKDSKLPIILGVDEQHPWVTKFPSVVESQKKLAAQGQNVMFTSMNGLEKADSSHLTPKGLEEHGNRLFIAYKALATEGQQDAAADAKKPCR